jgi:hypothetical protein
MKPRSLRRVILLRELGHIFGEEFHDILSISHLPPMAE